MNNILKSAALTAISIFAVSASANLIVNGSFEENDVPDSSWRWYESTSVAGWGGDNIEIWDSLQNVDSAVGDQHAELNAHPNTNDGIFSIYQDFDTVVGQWYDVSFFYSARTGNATSSDEAFNFSIVDVIDDMLIDDHVKGEWSLFEGGFMATSATSRIEFTSVTTGTYGNFLDGVSVSVPEPGSIALLSLGLVGLGLARKRTK